MVRLGEGKAISVIAAERGADLPRIIKQCGQRDPRTVFGLKVRSGVFDSIASSRGRRSARYHQQTA